MISSMYVHVPFCDHICAYCDFVRCGYQERLAQKWLDAVKKELQDIPIQPMKTIYIGGGTPSALSYARLKELLMLLEPYATQIQEYTMEANADSLSDDKIALLQHFGINRISMGAQTFQPELLKQIHRLADHACIKQRIEALCKAGITNISLDLLYGLPTQTMEMWENDLHKAVALPIRHLSLYALTIEEHSEFGRKKIQPCDEDQEADFYEKAIQVLQDHGFQHYEISSFAKPGYQSQHNLVYWRYQDFYGIGCGASGKYGNVRYDNTKNLHTYIVHGPCPTTIELSKEDTMFETIMMGLRLQEGVSEQQFQTCFHQGLWDTYAQAIQKQIALENLVYDRISLKTSEKGSRILHTILMDFLP